MGSLYLVATPIGNLKDITLRALEVLREVEIVACEDTRRTLKLLNAYEIRKHLVSCRAENEARVAESLCREIEDGKSVAYVSDAGTPGVSDPGAALVRAARGRGLSVVPVPGPSALATILSVSGFGEKSVTFEGFLSPKPGRRRARLRELLDREEGFVLYESPYRILKLLEDLADLSPGRKILVGREMTKLHEEYREAAPAALQEALERENAGIGEFTVLVSGTKMA
jgi:16S rRNA (cytidine1402-2'-O)-methyltransferase